MNTCIVEHNNELWLVNFVLLLVLLMEHPLQLNEEVKELCISVDALPYLRVEHSFVTQSWNCCRHWFWRMDNHSVIISRLDPRSVLQTSTIEGTLIYPDEPGFVFDQSSEKAEVDLSVSNDILSDCLSDSKLRLCKSISQVFSHDFGNQVFPQSSFKSKHFSELGLDQLDGFGLSSKSMKCLLDIIDSELMLDHPLLQSIQHFPLLFLSLKHVLLDQPRNTPFLDMESLSNLLVCEVGIQLEISNFIEMLNESLGVSTFWNRHWLTHVDVD